MSEQRWNPFRRDKPSEEDPAEDPPEEDPAEDPDDPVKRRHRGDASGANQLSTTPAGIGLRLDPFREFDALTQALLTGSNRSHGFLAVDIYRVDDEYVLTADLPGVDPGSVDVTVDNGTLTISADRTARSLENMQWLTNERFFGTYRRQLSLGEGIDAATISATYENGVLTVTIPLAERARPRHVRVAQPSRSSSDSSRRASPS